MIKKPILFIFILIVLLLIFYINSKNFYIWDYFIKNYNLLYYYATSNNASLIFFSLLYVLSTSLSLPLSALLTLVGSSIFGWKILPLVVISATFGAYVVYTYTSNIAHKYFKNSYNHMWVNKLRIKFNSQPLKWLLLLRIIPVMPFWTCNIISAIINNNEEPPTFNDIVYNELIFLPLLLISLLIFSSILLKNRSF